MGLFAAKKPCPNCGSKVKEPKSPDDFLCPSCEKPGPWASPEQIAGWHHKEAARATYEAILDELAAGADPDPAIARLAALKADAAYEPAELGRLNTETVQTAGRNAIRDDLVSAEEEAHLSRLMTTLGVGMSDVARLDPELPAHLLIASVNAGNLPEVREPHVMARKGEIVHVETNASLMKEVTVRQYVGGYQGVSIPIGKSGLRYRVGGARGHSVEVGTKLNVADTGLLVVTSKRIVYVGARKTSEVLLSKLVSIDPYTDGITLHASNRVNALIFSVPKGAEVVAAIINAAAQRLE
jgi:hypothetical protein